MTKEREWAVKEEGKRFEAFYLWLEENMPALFFKEVSQEKIALIVHSLMSFKVQGYFSEINYKNGAVALCLDGPDADVRILKNYPLFGIKSYTTYISSHPLPFEESPKPLRIALTAFTEAHESEISELEEREKILALFIKQNSLSQEQCLDLIERMDPKFLNKLSLDYKVIALELFHRASIKYSCQYDVKRMGETGALQIILAWKDIPKHNFLYRLARVVYLHGFVMKNVKASYITPHTPQSILMLSFELHDVKQETDLEDFLQEIVTLKYFGSFDLIDETFVSTKLLRGNLGNWLRTMVNFIHQVLVNADPNLYNFENIVEGICRHPELTLKLTQAFEYKFNPKLHDIKKYEELRESFYLYANELDTGQENLDRRRREILFQGMNFVEFTLKTNFYRENKTCFSFRLDPRYLDHAPFERKELFPELPYGIFFFKGRHFIGFHIRFRDLSRGGLRTIYPEKKERMLAERELVFQECYNLAYTQQKKNKDIPEGGSKGVIFLKPDERLEVESAIFAGEERAAKTSEEEIAAKVARFKNEQKRDYLYQTQRSYIKNFLLLINCESDGTLKAKNIIDYWKKPEYIYLGPDENMHDAMIEWIAEESLKNHYKPGGAFISGKSQIGINHKKYGVTSLGVNVFMQEVLKFLRIESDKMHFTVKMTGGPDGDVAGNQIKNLHAYFPQTAKLVALTDVSGTIFDPKGCDLDECLKLFKEQKPIRYYPPHKLSEGGFLLDLTNKRELTPYVFQTLCYRKRGGEILHDWLQGNEMNALYRTNVHQTYADIFIPCGGRPRTLREDNVHDFLDHRGRPTAKAIIEGANLYVTPWGRRALEQEGVLIVKDSSANKCGVISSSFEVLAGLILKDVEFVAAKSRLIEEILERLKKSAYDEARLLLNRHVETGEPLTVISEKISERINLFTDQLLEYLEGVTLSHDPNDPLIRCFLRYCLKMLRENYEERLIKEIPENHKKAIIACYLGSHLVYERGLSWMPSLKDVVPMILQDMSM